MVGVVTDVSRVRGGFTLPRWHVDAVSGRRPCHYPGPCPAGTSSRAEGPSPAEPAATTACPAPGANPAPTGGFAPIAGAALISRQEHEAWDVLLACQGQMRLAPSGHVIGIDMDAALRDRRRPLLQPRGGLGAAAGGRGGHGGGVARRRGPPH